MQNLDAIDRLILNEIQDAFPLSLCPYNDIGLRIGLTEAEVIEHIEKLKQAGIVRRIGGIIDSRKWGFYSTLCAARIPSARIDEIAEWINRLPQVTHNYTRDYEWNLWFTLTAESSEQVKSIINDIEQSLDIQVLNMPVRKLYKIKVSFDMGE